MINFVLKTIKTIIIVLSVISAILGLIYIIAKILPFTENISDSCGDLHGTVRLNPVKRKYIRL